MRNKDLGAVIILAVSRRGYIPYVTGPGPYQVLWRLPGGKIEEGETPEQTAWRELREETGLIIPIDSIELVSSEEIGKNGHIRYLCYAEVEHWSGLAKRGKTGEKPRLWRASCALRAPGFLHDHRSVTYNYLVEAAYRRRGTILA